METLGRSWEVSSLNAAAFRPIEPACLFYVMQASGLSVFDFVQCKKQGQLCYVQIHTGHGPYFTPARNSRDVPPKNYFSGALPSCVFKPFLAPRQATTWSPRHGRLHRSAGAVSGGAAGCQPLPPPLCCRPSRLSCQSSGRNHSCRRQPWVEGCPGSHAFGSAGEARGVAVPMRPPTAGPFS